MAHTAALKVRPSKAMDHLNRFVEEKSIPGRKRERERAGNRFVKMMEKIKAQSRALNLSHVSLKNHQVTNDIIAIIRATPNPGR